jgi:hypothetical protein
MSDDIETSRAKRQFIGSIVSIVAAVFLILSTVRYASDVFGRRAAERFLVDFDVTARRPAEAATIPYAPSADLAANLVADIALEDALGTVSLGDMTPDMRDRWLRAVERVDDELIAARDIALTSASERPGWAYHWAMLGRVVYTAQRRREDAPTDAEAREWQTPMAASMRYAPGDFSNTTLAASAYLEMWPFLGDHARNEGMHTIRRALLDATFAARELIFVLGVLGRDETVSLLPNEPHTLRAAVNALAGNGDMAGATAVYRRWETAEWSSRSADLGEIERRAQMNDVEALRSMTSDWLARHPASDFDTAEGRRQVMRVLQLSVNDHIGSWSGDARAAAVSFLLDGRVTPSRTHQGIETTPGGFAIANAVSALTAVPEPIRARAHLLSGDIYDAEAIFQRSDTAGSFEWTPFLVDLATYRLSQEMPDAARAALESLAPAARNECNALIAGRDVARATGAKNREQEIAALLPSLDAPIAASQWSRDGSLTLCVDPDLASARQLTTVLGAQQPALIEFGWNGGRRGTLPIPAGRTALVVPLTGLSGRSRFYVRAVAGGPAAPVETRVNARSVF